MNVLFDTNVIIDVLTRRMPFYEHSAQCFSLVSQGKISGLLSAHAITTIEYLASKHLPTSKRQHLIAELMSKFSIVDTTKNSLLEALSLDCNDFEDGVTYVAALSHDATHILTRNLKDFTFSNLPVLSPSQFIADLHQE